MKASILLNEIKESIENFDTTRIEESLKREDLNPISRQLSTHNLETCRDIEACEIGDDMDFDVDDGEIESFKKELHNFFEGNHVAMGLVQLVLSAAIMIINQRFFISGFKVLLHRAPNMDTLVADRKSVV